MPQPGARDFLSTVARQFQRLARALKEKPQVKLDDYVLEHLMLYHGLVGTTEENQKKFRDVRRDILDALQNSSAPQLAVAFKLPPLNWLDKLKTIFQQASEEFDLKRIRECLLPEIHLGESRVDDEVPDHIPLRHPDWRVRANAARVAASLEMVEAVPYLVQALNDNSEETKPAFLHVAYALSELRNPQSRLALVAQLQNEEPWFRVDAAGALACWPLADVHHDLMQAMLQPDLLNDYMAVAISRKYSPADLLENADDEIRQGALEVVIGLVQAARGPFANEVGRDVLLFQFMPSIHSFAEQSANVRSLRAVLLLSEWILEVSGQFPFDADDPQIAAAIEVAQAAQERFGAKEYSEKALKWLQEYSSGNTGGIEFRHALDLAARYRLSEAAPYLIPQLKADSMSVNEVLDAAGALSALETAPAIIEVIKQSVNMDDRTSRELSKQPVFEDDVRGSKTYWHALKALGSMPTDESVRVLLDASADFAADKRQRAIQSLVSVGAHEQGARHAAEIERALTHALGDPSPQVRAAAVRGVGELGLISLINEAIRLSGAKDTGVSRAAMDSLKLLSQRGHHDQVHRVITSELSGERDLYRRQKLTRLLENL